MVTAALRTEPAPATPRQADPLGLSIRGVSHQFDLDGGILPVLDDVSLDAAPGEFVALLGPSATAALERQVGTLDAARRGAVDAALERTGLSALASQRFGELSGGQQQRGILARALVSNPRLLLLDEPFNGLDRENRDALLELVRQLRAEGRTVIVSTHDLEIAQRACTHVLLLSAGHSPEQPGHPASFGPIDEALTLEAVEHAFQDTTVELDGHTVTTTRETE